MPNINVASPPQPSATVEYRLGDIEQVYEWHDESGVAPFTRLSVFDTPSVNLHVDDNLAYVYTPADLSLFTYVTAGIRSIQDRAGERHQEWSPGSNPFLRYFVRGTPIYQAVESLSAATDVGQLAQLAQLPPDAATERERLDREVAALRTDALETVLASHRDALRTLQELDRVATSTAQFDAANYNRLVVSLDTLRESYRKIREETFDPDELPGPPDDGWQSFVSAAAEYQVHLGLDDYPHEGDRCIYCRQELSEESIALVQRYQTFLDDAVARQVATARQAVATSIQPLISMQPDGMRQSLERRKEVGGDDEILNLGLKLAATISTTTAVVRTGAELQADDLTPILTEIKSALTKPLADHQGAIAKAEQQMTDRRAALAEAEAKQSDLTARIELDRRLGEMTTYVERAKRVTQLAQVVKRLPGVLRSLTEVSKLASEELINQDFEQRFREECRHLRTPTVKLEFVGREGKAQRRKSLAPSFRLSQILAEGEQKVLALADFIAEARLGGSSAPVILDDPVNSLDHRRLEEVARRIALLVDDRQVIVFTHNIWLATELLALFEKRKDECAYFAVTDDETTGAKGRVDRATGPRWDTEKDLGKRVQHFLDDAAKASGETQTALVESAYGCMRSWCEVAVEQVLFASVAQRYRANVMMGKLTEIRPDRLPAAIQTISEVFDRACRYIPDHSQPLHRLGTRPSLADAQADWAKLKEAIKAYRAA